MKSRKEKSRTLYTMALTKPTSYVPLAKILHETGNTKASQKLLDGVPLAVVLQLKLTINRNQRLLKELWRRKETLMWEKLKPLLSMEDLIKLCTGATSTDTTLQLLTPTFPAKLSYYIPRKLIRRVPIDDKLLKKAPEDIFVVQGISPMELATVAQGNRTDWSSNQTRNLTVRFILLEDEADWELICSGSQSPVHWLQYEEESKCLLLIKSVRPSDVLKPFTDLLESHHSDKRTAIVEETALTTMSESHDHKGFCICDSPGVGKSALFGNLARDISKNHPDRIVAYVELPLLTKNLTNLHSQAFEDVATVRRTLINHICPSTLSRGILGLLMEFDMVQVDLFLDGLEEVPPIQLETTKQLISTVAKKFPSTRIFITAAAELRNELVSTLGVTPYDIEPLTNKNMVDLMTKFWATEKSDNHKLADIATSCLENVIGPVNKRKGGISGTPLNCRILSDVYAQQALYDLKNKDTGIFTSDLFKSSLTNAYQRFVGVRFSHFQIGLQGPAEITPERIFDPVRGIIQAIVGEQVCSSDIVTFKRQHVLLALEIIFPSLADIYAQQYQVPRMISPSNEFGIGMLLVRRNGANVMHRFAHYTLAEYLVAEFLVEAITTSKSSLKTMKHFLDKVTNVLFDKILETTEHSQKVLSLGKTNTGEDYVIPLKSFRYPFIAKFLNDLLQDHFALSATVLPKLGATVYKSISKEKIYNIVSACCANNYGGLLIFIKAIMETEPSMTLKCKKAFANFESKILFENPPRALSLLYAVAKYSNVELAQVYMDLVTVSLGVNIHEACTRIPKSHVTPLHLAVSKGNLQMVNYFMEKNLFHTNLLLHRCVEFSHRDPPSTVQGKLEICNLLLNNKATNKHDCENVFTRKMIHLDLIKFLYKQGADLTCKDKEGHNIVINAAGYMSASGYRRLVQFLAEECKAKDFLSRINCPLHVILNFSKDLDHQTFLWLLDASSANLKETDDTESNLIHRAVEGNKEVGFIEALVTRGVDPRQKNGDGKTGLHLAAERHRMDLIRYFVSLGLNVNGGDNEDKTPLHLACKSFSTVSKLIPEGANMEAVDTYDNNIAHLAAYSMPANDFGGLVEMLARRYNLVASKLFSGRNKRGRTALQERFYSSQDVDATAVRIILGLPGMDVNEKDEADNGLILLAVKTRRSIGLQRALMELGVQCKKPNRRGENVLHLAVTVKDPTAVRFYVSRGVDIKQQDRKGETPIDRASIMVKDKSGEIKRSDLIALNKIVDILKEAKEKAMKF